MDSIESLLPDEETSTPALEPLAMVALDAGRMLMEAGASAASIDAMVAKVARGLGADRVDLRIGYASLAITIGIGPNGITRMREVGHLGVNQRMDQGLWHLADRVARGELTVEETRAELTRLAKVTPRHNTWVMAIAVGLACASFGRLLGVDWPATGPVFLAATIGQYLRRDLLARHVNVFICATVVALVASVLGGLGAHLMLSDTVSMAMIASILLLVPGIPCVNTQNDILGGHPTLGSARAVTVAVLLIFLAVGLWLGQVLIGAVDSGVTLPHPPFVFFVVHQTVFGAIAAVGFGVLFNIGFRALPWCALSGALALATRTCCLDRFGWNQEASSFAAAVVVGVAVQMVRKRSDIAQNALDVVGCIPMVPGSFAAKAILGMFALTSFSSVQPTDTLVTAVQYSLRLVFTVGAIGTGLAIPSLLLRVRVSH
jgi:uncharacterized membrane protein YjjP (DUF1212 family)